MSSAVRFRRRFGSRLQTREPPAICADYVEVRSDREREFEFVSRFTGDPTEVDYSRMGAGDLKIRKTRNTATSYWSQEMHEDAVAPLLEAIRRLDRE